MSDEQYEALRKQYAELVNYISAMARDVGALRQEVKEVNGKVDVLTVEVKQTNERLTDLEKRVKEIEYVLKNKYFSHARLQAEIDEHEDRIRALEGKPVL
jgi:peptidoglycan hydrolase CwlO-like protein